MKTNPNIWPQIQKGNQKAFEQLFLQLYEPLIIFAAKYHNDYEDQREVVQEVFADLWCKREQTHIQSSLKAYLYRAVRNKCLNNIKHLQVRANHAAEVIHTSPIGKSNEELEAKELQAKIQETLDGMPERTQEVFRLSREQGLKYKEIAELLEITVKGVEFQMGKALKTLRLELSEYLPVLILYMYSAL